MLVLPAEGKVTIKSLVLRRGTIDAVYLLGYSGQVDWQHAQCELKITVPKESDGKISRAFDLAGAALIPR